MIRFLFIMIFLLLDLVTKWHMESTLDLNQGIKVIPNWLSWNLIHNFGASFGIMAGNRILLIIIGATAIFLINVLYQKSKVKSFEVQLGFSLLLSGALGNWINRIMTGYVVDFIQFRLWPAIFNVADIEIRVGVLLLLYLYLTKRWAVMDKSQTRISD